MPAQGKQEFALVGVLQDFPQLMEVSQPEITLDYPGDGRSRQHRDHETRTVSTEKLHALTSRERKSEQS